MTALRIKFLVLAVAAQMGVLLWMYISTLLPLFFGVEARVQVTANYSWDSARGTYAELKYPIVDADVMDSSALGCEECISSDVEELRLNEVVYVMLSDCSSGVCGNGGVVLNEPDAGLYLRGRMRYNYWDNRERMKYIIVFPTINAWFATQDQAIAISKNEYGEMIAVLKILPGSGKAAILRLETANGDIIQ